MVNKYVILSIISCPIKTNSLYWLGGKQTFLVLMIKNPILESISLEIARLIFSSIISVEVSTLSWFCMIEFHH